MIIKKNKKIFSFLLVLFLGTGFLLLAPSAHASGEWAGEIIGTMISWLIGALMAILGLVMTALVSVAQYSNFIGAPAVEKGWSSVRDVCNMFFVLILLVIAFATILKIENYSYKKWLPKLILMAILINFSKTICGLLIDVTQIVMLTFVNAFKDIVAGNLMTTLGLTDILTLANNSEDVGFWAIVGAYVLGFFYTLIALVVIVTMLAMLVMRIIMIWIYVVLSPAAYLLSAFPGGQKYASQWWSEFIKNIIVGPVLAFFIWLSFVALQTQSFSTDFPVVGAGQTVEQTQGGGLITTKASTSVAMTATKASTPDAFVKFVIAIGMLLGGLKISQEIGGAAGNIAGKGMSKISQGTAFVGGAVSGYALGRAKAVGRGTRNAALGGSGALAKLVGKGVSYKADPNSKRNAIGQALQSVGAINSQWRKDAIQKTKTEKEKKRQKFLEKIGMGEKTMHATSEFLKTDSGKNVSNIAGAVGTGAVIGTAWAGPVGTIAGGLAGAVVGGLQGLLSPLAGWLKQKGADQTAAGNPWYGKRLKFMGEQASAVHSFATKTTQKGAKRGAEKIETANARVEVLAKNPGALTANNGMTPSTAYSMSGQTPEQVAYFDRLQSGDNPFSVDAIANLEKWAGSSYTGADRGYNYEETDPKQKERLESYVQGIAAYKKGNGGNNDISKLTNLITILDRVSRIGTVDSQKDKVIANRKTGKVGEQGSGGLAVETFAKNDTTKGNRDIIGVDFNKMKGTGLDPKAEASFPTGSEVGPIIQALVAQIKAERSNLVAQKADGSIDEAKFLEKNAILDKAEGRLANPDFEDLRLKNTASANYGRQESMTSTYHEEIHKGGVEDEDLTERMAQSLMANKLYGRNAGTKGRHATEIAEEAKTMKDQGMSNDVIMVEIDKEIKARLSAEGANRAARVIKMEKGEKETQSQAVEGKVSEPIRETVVEAASEKIGKPEEKQVSQKGEEKVVESRAVEEKTSKPESETSSETAGEATEEPKGPEKKPAAGTEQPTLNTEELQKALETLTEKVTKTASSFKPAPGGNKTSGSNNNLLFPLKQLNINMRKIPAAISKISGGSAPTTIIEASAINDAVNNTAGSDFGGEASSEGGSETGGKTSE